MIFTTEQSGSERQIVEWAHRIVKVFFKISKFSSEREMDLIFLPHCDVKIDGACK